MTSDLFSLVTQTPELTLNKMLTIVTKENINKQFSEFTCFIIHVDSLCVEERIHA